MALDLDPASAGHPGAPRYAGFWVRVLANVLDLLLIAAVNALLVMVIVGWSMAPRELSTGVGSVSSGISEALVETTSLWPVIFVVASWIALAATPGKLILGLRIIDSRTGGAPSVWQCIGRYLMAVVSVACAGIGYFWIALDARKQAWHDKIVGTVVIHTRT